MTYCRKVSNDLALTHPTDEMLFKKRFIRLQQTIFAILSRFENLNSWAESYAHITGGR
jgi:hypothetical protein